MSKFITISNEFEQARKKYTNQAMDLLVLELYDKLKEFNVFNASYHYHLTFDGWNYYKTYNDCQKSAGELISMLMDLQEKDGNTWSFYIENSQGDPKYFIEYNGYEFDSGTIGGDY